MSRIVAVTLLFVGMNVAIIGCGGDPAPPIPEPGSNAKSALEYVEEYCSSGIVLGDTGAHYNPGSAKDLGDNKFEIEDTNGKKYTVTVTAEGSGFKMGTPEPAK